jgi:hypothetical protein
MNTKDHAKALEVLKTLMPNDLVKIVVADNFDFINPELLPDAIKDTPETMITTGYYLRHNRYYIWLAEEPYVEGKPNQIRVRLTGYVIKVTRLKEI